MRKEIYTFNEETLTFEKLNKRSKEYRWKLLFRSVAFITLSLLFFKGYTILIDSPKEKIYNSRLAKLDRETDSLQHITAVLKENLWDIQERDNSLYRTVLELENIPMSIRNAGMGGTDAYKELMPQTHLHDLINVHRELDQLRKKVYIQSRSFDELIGESKERIRKIQAIPATVPLSGEQNYKFGSGFGYRNHPILKRHLFHKGIDIAAKTGTPIYATGNGKVVRQDYESGYGNRVIINHGYGYKTQYAHMSKVFVKVGDTIHRGMPIGLVGNTGRSTGPHVHYEVMYYNKAIDPTKFYSPEDLNPEEYKSMLEGQKKFFEANKK